MTRILSTILFALFIIPVFAQKEVQLLKIADSLYSKNKYEKAIEYYLETLKEAERSNNILYKAYASKGLGRCHYYNYEKDKALKWFYEYYHTSRQIEIDTIVSDALYHLSIIYVERNEYDSIQKYLIPAFDLLKIQKKYDLLSKAYAIYSEFHINKTKDENQIEKYLSLTLQYADSTNNYNVKIFAITKFFNYYYRVKKDYKKALYYINKAEDILKYLSDSETISYIYRYKAECLIYLRDTLAIDYIQKWFNIKDTLFDIEKTKQIAKYEELYELNKKESENLMLKQQNQLNELNLQIRKFTIIILILVLIVLAVIALWYINLKINQNKKIKLEYIQKIHKEKQQISRDLHDNVGGQISYLITNLEWIANHPESIKNNNDLQKKLFNLSEIGRNAILTLRETIWAVNNEELSIIDFTDRFKNYILKLQLPETIKVNTHENFLKPENILRPEQALNLFRICQEALHNALKHSNATEINIYFESNESCLFKISIEDNGIGFDYQNRYKEGHYGMKNMEERAKESNAEFNVYSELNKGTKISICIKYPTANEVL
ncbi:MAG: ATP-binding protein [Bacteroidia bacterium]